MSDIPAAASLDWLFEDEAHERTNKTIEKMEKQITKEYKAAYKEMSAKLKKFGEKFDEKDKIMKQKMLDGEISKKDYSEWRVRTIATGDRYKAMIDTLAEDMARANDIAKSTINGHMEEVYSMNRNYAVFQAEKDAMIDTSYTLYNRRATEELFRNKKSLLPAPKPGTKAWKAAHDKDLRWNQQKINSSLIQGLLQGESIPDIAKRLINVVGMNRSAAVRNARTMTTGIENKGRDDGYADLRKKGIEMDTIWVSTLDDRTRHSHRLLHGEVRNEKTGKYSNKLRYPGDPEGDPAEVYNCRCCEISSIKGFPIDIPRWSPKMGDMTFDEWLGVKEDGESPASITGSIGEVLRDDRRNNKIETREDAENYLRTSLQDAYDLHRIENNMISVPSAEFDADEIQKTFYTSFANVSDDVGIKASETVSNLIREYDTPLQVVRTMSKDEAFESSNTYAYVFHEYSTDKATMLINPLKCKDYDSMVERLKRNVEIGYSPKIHEDKIDQYVFTHEFAHSLLDMQSELKEKTNWVGANYDKIRSARKEIDSIYTSYLKELGSIQKKVDEYQEALDNAFIASLDGSVSEEELQTLDNRVESAKSLFNGIKISDYSMENSDEFMAEAFAFDRLGDGNDYSRQVREVLDRYFKWKDD